MPPGSARPFYLRHRAPSRISVAITSRCSRYCFRRVIRFGRWVAAMLSVICSPRCWRTLRKHLGRQDVVDLLVEEMTQRSDFEKPAGTPDVHQQDGYREGGDPLKEERNMAQRLDRVAAGQNALNTPYGGYFQREVPAAGSGAHEYRSGDPDGRVHAALLAAGLPVRRDRRPLPQPIRIMGEDLVAFRDLGGRVGVLHRHCSHPRRVARIRIGAGARHPLLLPRLVVRHRRNHP